MEKNVQSKNTKRKHLNKNKKKSWRKVNIDDVDDFLEDQRLQERTGGLVAEKKDESLFFVDTVKPKVEKVVETKTTRKRKAQNHLKDIEVALQPPPPKKKDKRLPAVIEREASGKVTAKQRASIAARQNAKAAREQRLKEQNKTSVADFDIWADDDGKPQKEDEHYLRVTKKMPTKVPGRLRQASSKVAAVEPPHPGASYNPAFSDHQDLLNKAQAKEERKVRQEKRIRRAMDEKFPSARDAPTEASNLKEMSAGLFHDEADDSDESEAGDLDKLSVNPPVRRENKKDERKRKKEKARKQKAKEITKLKAKRMQDNSFFRLKSIKAEVNDRQMELQARQVKRAEEREKNAYKTQRLSRQKFEEPDLEIKLEDELVGSLREIKPEGNLLLDRFHSMMKRNILEPRGVPGKSTKRKYKPKVFEKKSHKEIT